MRKFVLVIVLVGAVLRLIGLDWDEYRHYQPDERYITWVATTIEAPAGIGEAFSPHLSPFNPYYWPPQAESVGILVPQDEPRNFAYGHLPLYLGVIATRLAEWLGQGLRDRLPAGWLLTQDILNGRRAIEFLHLTAVSRMLTALIDVGTLILVYGLGKRLYGPPAGALAAALLAINVQHIQLAHFFAVDPYLAFFTVATIWALVAVLDHPGRSIYRLLAAILLGLAVSAKFSAILLCGPMAMAFWLAKPQTQKQYRQQLAGALVVSGLTFGLCNPFALLDWTCQAASEPIAFGPVTIPAIEWRSCFLENIGQQSVMVGGDENFPFTFQYEGTLPYLYPLEMQLRWGMGLILGLAAVIGFGWAVWRGWREADPAGTILLTWTIPYFLITGSFYVKFMRYLLPLTPFLMIYAAGFLLKNRLVQQRPKLAPLLMAAVLLPTTLYALAFVGIYRQPHPWNEASRWIYRHVPAGTLILSEYLDDFLPTSNLIVDGVVHQSQEYPSLQLNWMIGTEGDDDLQKLDRNLALLAQADYVTLVSNRLYGVVPRLPDKYPLSSRYYQLLFSGQLGYEVVYVTGRYPTLFGFFLQPDTFGWPGLTPPPTVSDYLAQSWGWSPGRADESFTVYDQPLTMIFRNTGRLPATTLHQLFTSPD